MDRSCVIELLEPKEYTTGFLGTQSIVSDLPQVYAQVDSVSQHEYFEGGRQGLRPAYKFTVWAADYTAATRVYYNGAWYVIYRTYERRDGRIELYCQVEGGPGVG